MEEEDICCAAVRMLPRPTLPQNKYSYYFFFSLSPCSLSLDFVFPKTVWGSWIGTFWPQYMMELYDVGFFFRELIFTLSLL